MSARLAWLAPLLAVSLICCAGAGVSRSTAEDEPPRTLPTNRVWDVLEDPRRRSGGERAVLRAAGQALGEWRIHLAGVDVDGARLLALAEAPDGEPILRHVREGLRRPIDLGDFLLFLDDVLYAGRGGLRGETVWVTPGRARKAGILIHPSEVFAPRRPRRYGESEAPLGIDAPTPQKGLPPAPDGAPPGPEWTARYRNPEGEPALIAALAGMEGRAHFAQRLQSLMAQLREAGAVVYLNSTVRRPERGYLMWGAFVLGREQSEAGVRASIARLDEANRAWGLDVPIRWAHPEGWRRTREAAREMAESYQVVYATENGARSSDHYTGRAVDLVAVGLPRHLDLSSPAGVRARFDLSDPEQSRDLSLTPALIDWVEVHFDLEKLLSDYPHWRDARTPARLSGHVRQQVTSPGAATRQRGGVQ
jgi:hypothetical protein